MNNTPNYPRFDTRNFVNTYCRAPHGRGVYAFEFHRHYGGLVSSYPAFAPSGTYTEAKKWATSVANFLGAQEAVVLT